MEEFLAAVKEVEEVLEGKRPHTKDTKAAMKSLAKYARQKEADVRAKRKQLRAGTPEKGGKPRGARKGTL